MLGQDICQKLGQGLGYFARVQNIDQLRLAAREMKEKIAGKIDISDYMRENLIVPFAESLSIECKFAVQILDEYFSRNSSRLTYFCSLEKHLEEITKNMQQMQQQNIYFDRMQEQQRSHDNFRQEILKTAAQCRTEARETYFNERIKLLNCIGLAINEALSDRAFRSLFDDFVHMKLIRDSNLTKNMLEGLLRNLDWEKEFKSED